MHDQVCAAGRGEHWPERVEVSGDEGGSVWYETPCTRSLSPK